MATIINTRSPFFIRVIHANLTTVTLQLYIYEGTIDPSPDAGDLKYTIVKASMGELVVGTYAGDDYAVFEISELIRDYIETKYDGEYDSYSVWVNPVITAYDVFDNPISSPVIEPDNSNQFIAVEGYGYFEEGKNPQPTSGLLQSNNVAYRPQDGSINIPILAEKTNSVSFYNKGEIVRTQAISDNGNTDQKIQYIASDGNPDSATYKERVLEDGGIFEDSRCLQDFLGYVEVGEFDEVWVNYDTGSLFTGANPYVTNTSTEDTKTDIVKIKTLDCSKYEPIRVTFVNKFGALQDIWFDKKSIESTNVQKQSYNANIFDFNNFDYDTTSHQTRTLSTMAKESIVLNTGFVDDSYNEVIRQLMLSEQVWLTRLTDKELVLPVTVKTQSVQYKTRVNDRLVNYTVEFDMAFDKINSIR
jgi:hypothetical protein